MTPQIEPALLRLEQVASRLAVSPSTVRRLIRRGDLPVVRVGRQLRVRPADLADFIQSHTEDKGESHD